MTQKHFNEFYAKYEKTTNSDDFNNISVFGFSSMTQKQMDKFATIMIRTGCAIRQNRLNEYYVYNNQGVGIKISKELLIKIIKGE